MEGSIPLLISSSFFTATPGNVYIKGECIDCNKPEVPHEGISAGVSQTLTFGAVGFAVLYSFLGSLLRIAAH